jgi:lycopene beta-cyclase
VVDSERFASVLSQRFAGAAQCALRLGCSASRIEAQCVELTNGERLQGSVVIDARGPERDAYAGRCGYQKFLGLELQFARPHGLAQPLLMDARCAQLDGFRFFYLLPLAADRLLIEETRFSRTSALDDQAARTAIYRYAERFGAIERCVREERGILPMPWSTAALPRGHSADAALVAGYRGGFFHPATGYSLPAALRVAEVLGEQLAHEPFGAAWQRFMRQHRAQAGYALQLNRLLFSAFAETDMWGVLARFYHLPEALIERFYAMDSSLADRARILIGKPPRGFSVLRAMSQRKGAA